MSGADSKAGTVRGAWRLEDLAKEVRRRKAAGDRIVLTNGCFDLIHVGHVRTLHAARRLGDALVVAVNTDASVRGLEKAPGRPIVPEAERAEALAALACVDYVVLFDEPDPRRVVLTLDPDILAKGGDWSPDTIIGREEVESRGGRVVALPDVPGVRTTRLIERVLAEVPPEVPSATRADSHNDARADSENTVPGSSKAEKIPRGDES